MLNSPALIIGILGLIVILAVAFARIKKAKKTPVKKDIQTICKHSRRSSLARV